MKRLLILLLIGFLSISAFGAKKEAPEIIFDDDSHFAVTDEFNEDLLEDFITKVMTYDKEDMTIYFDSPGGSVIAMSRIIAIMNSSDIKFTCVARFAASAAFAMFQACDVRYILKDGIIMQHNASGMFRGELTRVRTLLEAIEAIVKGVEINTAKRMKIPYDTFKALINNNLWIPSTKIFEYNAADAIVKKISCTKELIKKEIRSTKKQCGLFTGKIVDEARSACPLLKRPIITEDERTEQSNPANFIYRIKWVVPNNLRGVK